MGAEDPAAARRQARGTQGQVAAGGEQAHSEQRDSATPATRRAAEQADSRAAHEQAGQVQRAVAEAHSEHWGRLLALLTRLVGNNLDVAEESLQDAYETALTAWARDGIPTKRDAWLLTAARRQGDRPRSAGRRRSPRKLPLLLPEEPEVVADMSTIPDERLRLLFTCCHPALPAEARVALTLRLLGGLTTAEIARAFLVARADDGRPDHPGEEEDRRRRHPVPGAGRTPSCPSGSRGVLAVLYLVFTEGHSATSGDEPVRRDLCDEAIRLARVLRRADAGRAGGGRPAGADAAAPRPPATPGPRRTAGWCCCRSRTGPAGTGRRSPRALALRPGRGPARPAGPYRCRRRSRPSTRRRPVAAEHRLGPDRRPLRRRWQAWPARRWSG